MIEGGWSYIMAAYGITWTGLALYAVSLRIRHKQTKADLEAEGWDKEPHR